MQTFWPPTATFISSSLYILAETSILDNWSYPRSFLFLIISAVTAFIVSSVVSYVYLSRWQKIALTACLIYLPVFFACIDLDVHAYWGIPHTILTLPMIWIYFLFPVYPHPLWYMAYIIAGIGTIVILSLLFNFLYMLFTSISQFVYKIINAPGEGSR